MASLSYNTRTSVVWLALLPNTGELVIKLLATGAFLQHSSVNTPSSLGATLVLNELIAFISLRSTSSSANAEQHVITHKGMMVSKVFISSSYFVDDDLKVA